ncbi:MULTISPECIES: gamma carbonic anhydrase family protein [Tsukamurella]|uniref:Gamma carbonic anhydrase family protein n=1 Tax=Tsukamurella strandjordii TaxID=147577 RepID=A0AA90SPY1_9ACTN|nr:MULTISPECIES: gamma carbonic anhydrase family protein [Tsukamurella]MDP0397311.1 gamma carbonic anhydrase family protein [Tsukamurella strandjordii]GIZ98740.1 gamma carbonic anhydrase family protein [Tsukamurella sp. TY48]
MIARFGQMTPRVAETAWVADNATVIGDVDLGDGVGVFYGAVIRGDMATIAVGAHSNVQDGVVLHADPGVPLTVGERVSIGHNAVLHGCTVGDDVLVGMGATVLNGAVIGAGSLIAANALVPQGMEIPPGSMVAGVPAKVRRELSDAERAGVSANASVYVELTRAHASQTGPA